MTSPTAIVAYLALFSAAGVSFLFINLLVGKLLRPALPNREKLEVYECGEPTIGSSFVQFDLRFYVVALLFIIFDVEVAFFFPWATVFGKATHLMDPAMAAAQAESDTPAGKLTKTEANLYRELGVSRPQTDAIRLPSDETWQANRHRVQEAGRRLALFSIIDIAAFFAILLVGFAYVWRRGDLDWVRAVSRERGQQDAPPGAMEEQPVLSA